MPPATSLQFYRKRQSTNNFSLERPKSLAAFRYCVSKTLVGIEKRLELLQQSFYGPQKDVEQEIKQWLGPLAIVLKQSRVSVFLCKTQLEDMYAKYKKSEGDPTLVVDFDKPALKTVIDVIERVLDYLKTGFADINKEVKQLGEYMWKYCLSFSDTEGDSYLDTTINYERQRRDFYKAINFNIDDIVNMAEQFETKGMRVQDLGLVARDLAERCQVTHVPFLVIIPQAFENIRNAISGLRKWLDADEGYAEFLKYDIDDLEGKREAQEKLVRDLQNRCSNCDHKLKTARRHYDDINTELKTLQNREVMLTKEIKILGAKNKDVIADLEIKNYRKDELQSHLDELSDFELENYKQLLKEITLLNERRLNIEEKLEEFSKKMTYITERKEIMEKREKDVSDAKVEGRKMKKEFRRSEVELERIECHLGRLKEIYRYKTTPEVLKKIFHGMPLTARHVVNKGRRPIVDKLERACRMTASNIEHDWARLYRALPFYPPRGQETIGNDIDEIGKEYMRQLPDEMCRQSLWRWRRMHTRASFEDLKKALLSIRRKDIVDKIDEENARRTSKPSIPSPAFRTVRFPKLIT